MSEEEQKWWLDPRGLVASLTIAAMVLGFFYVRERQMWQYGLQIDNLEKRGEHAINRMDGMMDRLTERLSQVELKVDRLEQKEKPNQ